MTANTTASYVKQPRRDIRPAPFKCFRGRTYAAAVSPESRAIMAKLGVGLLIIPQKPWERGREGARPTTARIYREINGEDAPPPIIGRLGVLRRGRRAGRARWRSSYIGGYYHSVLRPLPADGRRTCKTTKGYEYYAPDARRR